MGDESKKVDQVREDRIRETAKEPLRQRPKEGDFEKVLERSRLASQLAQPAAPQQKTVTEEAIKEAAKREERQGEERRRDEDEGKDRRDSRQRGERSDSRVADHRVVAKAQARQDGGGGGSREGGQGTFGSRRELARILSKGAAKSLPVDLQGKFASRLADAMKGKDAAAGGILAQHILNKIVQCVRIGLNRKGEKEVQIDLHERVFRGLRLKVAARDGKVAVHFLTRDAAGRKIFERSREAIRGALERKGIEVDEILIS